MLAHCRRHACSHTRMDAMVPIRLPLLSLFACSAFATAQISTTGTFTGTVTEEFETQSMSNSCVPGRVFLAQADLCTPAVNGCMITYGWLLYVGYAMYPHNQSNSFFGTTLGHAMLTFDTPAQRFGGFFGTVGYLAGGVATFYDSADNVLATLPITAPRGNWAWNGWDAGAGAKIKRVEMVANDPYNGGALLCIDDAEYDPYGAVAYFGSGCSGSLGTPSLRATGPFGIGETLAFAVTNTAAPIAALYAGLDNATWHGQPLPLSLAFAGAPGCSLLISPDVGMYFGPTGSMPVAIPRLSILRGVTIYWQCALFGDPGGHAAVTTRGAAVTLW
jgi:hypothetical protein